ncbi:MAG: histidine phosphatase family protein [Lachnospiraceae bacterium]|nr:histidine phosphatase family protein [Lachnospiraceae bacterium]
MRLYMIRHGETQWNVSRRFQGRSDIPLNDEGRRLARITAEALAEVPFARIYTSPLKRARETAELIKGERDIPVILDERIIEIGFGVYEGLCCGKDNYNIPDPEFMNFFDKPEAYKPPEGAESIEELKARTADFLQEIVHNKDMENDTILVSTHGAALRGLLSSINNIGIEDFWKGGVHKNCAVTIVDVDVKSDRTVIREEGKTYY